MGRYAGESDDKLIFWLAKLGYARVPELSYLLGRSKLIVRRRLRALGPTRVARTGKNVKGEYWIRSLDGPKAFQKTWFLTQSGWDLALSLGFVDYAVSATDEKAVSQLPHDLAGTDLFVALTSMQRAGEIEELHFSRTYRDCYHRWGNATDEFIKHDGYFWFKVPGKPGFIFFFLEVENGGNNLQERVQKIERYSRYPHDKLQEKYGADNFFVLTLTKTDGMALSFRNELQKYDRLKERRYWIADYSAIRQLSGKVFKTPKDEALALTDAANFK